MSDTLVRTERYRLYHIDIHYDDCPEDPLDMELVGEFLFDKAQTRGFSLGKKGYDINVKTFLSGSDAREAALIYELEFQDHGSNGCRLLIGRELSKQVSIVHVTQRLLPEDEDLSPDDEAEREEALWADVLDEDTDGFFVVSKKALQEFDGDLEKLRACALADIKMYGDYLNGNIYHYCIKDPQENEIEDSWHGGFYGDWDESGLMEDARSEINAQIKYNREQRHLRKWESIKRVIYENIKEGLRHEIKTT